MLESNSLDTSASQNLPCWPWISLRLWRYRGHMKPVCQRHRSGDSEAVVQANLLLEYVTGDWMRVVLTNLHPKDGLSAMFLCKGVRSSLGSLDTMWEMWAHTLWPRNTVIPAIPCLYPTFEALVRDNNRRGECMPA